MMGIGITLRVARGAQLLDREVPTWFREVNVDQLDIMCPDRCIIGQLFGGFTDGVEALELRAGTVAGDYGFDLDLNASTQDEEEEERDWLNRTWIDVILARRAELG